MDLHKLGTGTCDSCEATNVEVFAAPRTIQAVCWTCIQDMRSLTEENAAVAAREAWDYENDDSSTLPEDN